MTEDESRPETEEAPSAEDMFAVAQPIVARISRNVCRKFSEYLEVADIQQHLIVWCLERPDKLAEWLTPTDEDPTCYHGKKQLRTTLYRKANGLAQQAKADRLGYRVDDLYWYSPQRVGDLLARAFDYSEWLPSPQALGTRTSGADPAVGNNLLALFCDVKIAYEAGSAKDRDLLWKRYVAVPPVDEITLAEDMGVSRKTITRMVNQALGRIVKRLGGFRPEFAEPGRRKSLTNAEALWLTENPETVPFELRSKLSG